MAKDKKVQLKWDLESSEIVNDKEVFVQTEIKVDENTGKDNTKAKK
jgi:hypothetical protein